MIAAKTKDLHKLYYTGTLEVPALKGIDIEINHSEFSSITGSPGSGKTTLLNILGCLDTPSNGQVFLENNNVSMLSPDEQADIRNFNIGFISQTFLLVPTLTIFENVELPLLVQKKLSAGERKEVVMNMLEQVEISDLAHRKPAEINGGQKQMAAIARAMVKIPKIILADDPTANLDSRTSELIVNLMLQFNKKTKTTFIFSSNDPVIMKHADRLIKIHNGKVESDEVSCLYI
ncbi:MAG: ABC transporter ATP-binding protein [bacterium]|nr:ABC transporter ATP-binding protein [bacterium]